MSEEKISKSCLEEKGSLSKKCRRNTKVSKRDKSKQSTNSSTHSQNIEEWEIKETSSLKGDESKKANTSTKKRKRGTSILIML